MNPVSLLHRSNAGRGNRDIVVIKVRGRSWHLPDAITKTPLLVTTHQIGGFGIDRSDGIWIRLRPHEGYDRHILAADLIRDQLAVYPHRDRGRVIVELPFEQEPFVG